MKIKYINNIYWFFQYLYNIFFGKKNKYNNYSKIYIYNIQKNIYKFIFLIYIKYYFLKYVLFNICILFNSIYL